MSRPTAFDAPLYVAAAGLGIVLIALARRAAGRGARWESLVALRVGSALFTEVLGAFLVGYGVGALLAVQMGPGNVRAVAATAEVDIAEGAHVAVVGTRDLDLVVAPR